MSAARTPPPPKRGSLVQHGRGIAFAANRSVTRANPANDPTVLTRLSDLIGALEEERRQLARRLAEIERELSRLASAVASRDDLRA